MIDEPEIKETCAETVIIPRVEYETLKAEHGAQKEQIAELSQQVNWLMEQMRLAHHRQFSSSSEKSEYDQINFFNEAETTASASAAEPELTVVEKHYRKKASENGDRLPPDLPVEVVEHALPEEEQICPVCGEALHVIGRETRRELKLIPAKALIVEHVRLVYACRTCEKNACDVPVVKAPIDEPVIKGSFASPEAVAHILTQKFVSGVPLYRQEQEFDRNGIGLSRQTMSNWVVKCSHDWWSRSTARCTKCCASKGYCTRTKPLSRYSTSPARRRRQTHTCGCTEQAEIPKCPLSCTITSRTGRPSARQNF